MAALASTLSLAAAAPGRAHVGLQSARVCRSNSSVSSSSVAIHAELSDARRWGTSVAVGSTDVLSLADDLAALSPISTGVCVIAVPKKGTSHTKTKIRRAVWKMQARAEAKKALSLAKSVLSGRSTLFVYIQNDKDSKKGEEGSDETPAES